MTKDQGGSSYICRREMKRSLLDSSDRDESNGSRHMSLGSMDEKLFAFFYFHIFTDISLSIDLRDMKRLSLDAPCYGESNELRFVVFQSLVHEIRPFNDLKK